MDRIKTTTLIGISVVLLIFFGIVANPSSYFFLNDDFIHIPLAAKNNMLQGFYRPLANLSLWMDNKIWGRNAFGYHLTNVLIHLGNSVLIFFVGKKVFSVLSSTENFLNEKSACSALLFFIYAYHSEPVFWIIGRGASLATLFFLLALLFYLKSWSGAFIHYIGSLFFFGAGLFVYEVIWCYPLIVLIFLILFKSNRIEFKKLLMTFVLFTLFLLLRFQATNAFFGGYERGVIDKFNVFSWVYKFNTLLARCFLPPMKSGSLFAILYIAFISVFAIILVRYRRNKHLLAFFCCLVLSILPVVPLGIDTHDSESERYIYLATVFAVFFIVEFLFHFNGNFFRTGFALLILFHGYEMVRTAGFYRFSSMVAKKSLECLPVSGTDTVKAINLPTQYEGALIFRSGFPEALEWFKGLKAENVHVLNQQEVFKTFSDLYCDNLRNNNPLRDPFDENSLHKDTMGANTVFLKWQVDSLFFKRE